MHRRSLIFCPLHQAQSSPPDHPDDRSNDLLTEYIRSGIFEESSGGFGGPALPFLSENLSVLRASAFRFILEISLNPASGLSVGKLGAENVARFECGGGSEDLAILAEGDGKPALEGGFRT